MIVYCNFAHSDTVNDKTFYLYKFVAGMLYHFQNINFGTGVKEIVYYGMCDYPSDLDSTSPWVRFGSKNKCITCSFYLNNEKVSSLEGDILLKFVAEQMLLSSNKFIEKKIKDFSVESYCKSLSDYFSYALPLVMEGRNLEEGKSLNEDIKLAMWKKFSRL